MPNVPATAQFLMWPAEIVGASDQVHPSLQCHEAVSGVATFACESRQAFTHRPIEPLDKGRIEHCPSPTRLEQVAGLRKGTQRHLAGDFHHPFLLGSLDHCRNPKLRPHLQTGASSSACLLDFFAKCPLDAPG